MINSWVNLYPATLLIFFLLFVFSSSRPDKVPFMVEAFGALLLALLLSHLNRWFDLWPAHRLFPSAHLTFCLGLSVSLGRLRPVTLAITLPALVPFGALVLCQHYHSLFDLAGAFPLVLLVYGIAYGIGRRFPAAGSGTV